MASFHANAATSPSEAEARAIMVWTKARGFMSAVSEVFPQKETPAVVETPAAMWMVSNEVRKQLLGPGRRLGGVGELVPAGQFRVRDADYARVNP